VTDKDVQEFMRDRLEPGVPTSKVEYGQFCGYSASYSKDGRFWKEWWLRSGGLLVYVTYNVSLDREQSELSTIEEVLGSLMPVEAR
jgi:hypothetical protein